MKRLIAAGSILLTAHAAMAGFVTTGTTGGTSAVGSDPATGSTGFTVETTDLINGSLPTTLSGDTGDAEGLGTDTTGGALTNGVFGPPSSHPAPNAQMTLIHNGVNIDYALPVTANGYNITSIGTYAGWQDSGRAAQNYQVLVSVANGPFQRLGLPVNYGSTAGVGNPVDTRVILTDNQSGNLATNVTAVRFSFPNTQNGYVGYRELDVLGTPSSAALKTNLLTNGSFEEPLQAGAGNHIGATPTGWSVNTGAAGSFNLVQDGPGARDGGQYLDLTANGTYVYQTFTLAAASTVDFGAYFSPRDGLTGGGHAGIYTVDQSSLADGPIVAPSVANEWDLSSGTSGVLQPGTYRFVAFVDEPANVDSAYVYATAVTPEPASLSLLALAGFGLARRRK